MVELKGSDLARNRMTLIFESWNLRRSSMAYSVWGGTKGMNGMNGLTRESWSSLETLWFTREGMIAGETPLVYQRRSPEDPQRIPTRLVDTSIGLLTEFIRAQRRIEILLDYVEFLTALWTVFAVKKTTEFLQKSLQVVLFRHLHSSCHTFTVIGIFPLICSWIQ
jgi:hypothetical protein